MHHSGIVAEQDRSTIALQGIKNGIQSRVVYVFHGGCPMQFVGKMQKALFHLADELHRAASMEDVYNVALNAILDALQCNRASILLCDDAGVMHFKSWRGLSNDYRAATDGHSAWRPDERNPQPVCITDINTADLSESLKAVIRKEGIGALAFIPLVLDGKLTGKFMVYFNTPHPFAPDEIDVSLTIARQ